MNKKLEELLEDLDQDEGCPHEDEVQRYCGICIKKAFALGQSEKETQLINTTFSDQLNLTIGEVRQKAHQEIFDWLHEYKPERKEKDCCQECVIDEIIVQGKKKFLKGD